VPDQREVVHSTEFTEWIEQRKQADGYAKCSKTKLPNGKWLATVGDMFKAELKKHTRERCAQQPCLLNKLMAQCPGTNAAVKVASIAAELGLVGLAESMLAEFLGIGEPKVSAGMNQRTVTQAKSELAPLRDKLALVQSSAPVQTCYVAAAAAAWQQTSQLPRHMLEALESSSASWFELSEPRRNQLTVGLVMMDGSMTSFALLDQAVRPLRSTQGSVAKGSRLRSQEIVKALLTDVQPPAMSLMTSSERAEKLSLLITQSTGIPISVEPGLGVAGIAAVRTCLQLFGETKPPALLRDLEKLVKPEHISACQKRNRDANLLGQLLTSVQKFLTPAAEELRQQLCAPAAMAMEPLDPAQV
jgi:hypothetical protein